MRTRITTALTLTALLTLSACGNDADTEGSGTTTLAPTTAETTGVPDPEPAENTTEPDVNAELCTQHKNTLTHVFDLDGASEDDIIDGFEALQSMYDVANSQGTDAGLTVAMAEANYALTLVLADLTISGGSEKLDDYTARMGEAVNEVIAYCEDNYGVSRP